MSYKEVLSIVIPTYNRSYCVGNAIQSILDQKDHNLDIEIILIDDGSTDNTESLIKTKYPFVRYYKQENKGVTAARNVALKLVTGDYVAFLDSDDLWLPGKLSSQMKIFYNHPEVVMTWTDMSSIDSCNNIINEKFLRKFYSSYKYFNFDSFMSKDSKLESVYIGNIYPYMFYGNMVHTSTIIIRKSVLEYVKQFNPKFARSGEDYDFHFRSSSCGLAGFLDKSTILYKYGSEDQLTHPKYDLECSHNNLDTVNNQLRINYDIFSRLDSKMFNKRLWECYSWVSSCELNVGNRLKSFKYLIQSMEYAIDYKLIGKFILSFFPSKLFNYVKNFKRKIIIFT